MLVFSERGLERGPSPRVRGSRQIEVGDTGGPGSIPACAGKPRRPASSSAPDEVHPRVCGEAQIAHGRPRLSRGPSPRVRGSRGDVPRAVPSAGSIPACAGKPGPWPARVTRTGVHPRVCGEADANRFDLVTLTGPSPRVRGSPEGLEGRCESRGSIPACAGKPSSSRSNPCDVRVHPRVCGEAQWKTTRGLPSGGPSPRVRGSHASAAKVAHRQGSIPACAGKPS